MNILNQEGQDNKDDKLFEKQSTDSESCFMELWDIHFGYSEIGVNQGATCMDCEQYLKGDCEWGWIPELCIQTMVDHVIPLPDEELNE